VILAAAAAVGAWSLRSHDARGRGASAAGGHQAKVVGAKPIATHERAGKTVRLVASPAGPLPHPVQDAAAARAGQETVLLLGGLTAADSSTPSIVRVGTTGSSTSGKLATAVHDAAAATLGGRVFLFGGGDGVRQHDEIVRVDPSSGRTTVVGRLPAPSSDQAAAALGNTSYVVGGYTGSRWLDTIVAWRPGSAARVVAHGLGRQLRDRQGGGDVAGAGGAARIGLRRGSSRTRPERVT
jgi:hypothetical protein